MNESRILKLMCFMCLLVLAFPAAPSAQGRRVGACIAGFQRHGSAV